MEAFLIIGMLLLAFWNGANDVSRSIATLVGSGLATDRRAVAWGALWTVIGALLAGTFALGLASLFTSGILASGSPLTDRFAASVLAAAILWIAFATRAGLPVSTTHTLTGALVGTALFAFGMQGVHWGTLASQIIVPLLLSPFLAMGLTAACYPMIRRVIGCWPGLCLCVVEAHRQWIAIDAKGNAHAYAGDMGVHPLLAAPETCGNRALSYRVTPDTLHWMTSGLTSLARGMNDTPKIVALGVVLQMIGTPEGAVVPPWIFYAAALAMGMGSYLAGLRVTDVLARRVVPMDPLQGFSANLTTALLVGLASPLGLPVSTTQVSAGAIFGIGLARKGDALRWQTVREIALAWAVTLPAAGFLGAGAFWMLAS